MPMNLELHRSDESIWDRADDRFNWDAERWLLAGTAGAFLIAGLRRRSVTGLALILGSGALAWWASSANGSAPSSPWPSARGAAVAPAGRSRSARRREESFPASDAPAWTPTTGQYDHGADESSPPFPVALGPRDGGPARLPEGPAVVAGDSDAHGSRSDGRRHLRDVSAARVLLLLRAVPRAVAPHRDRQLLSGADARRPGLQVDERLCSARGAEHHHATRSRRSPTPSRAVS